MAGIQLGLIGSFPTPVTSSFDSIATQSLSGVSTITFSSIPSTYKSLQLRIINNDGAGYSSNIRVNSDTGSNYAWHRLMTFDSAGTQTVNASGSDSTTVIPFNRANGSIADQFDVGIVDIIDYASTSKYKTVRIIEGLNSNGAGESNVSLRSGLWMSTTAINSITFLSSGTFVAGSSIALYGIK